MHRRLRCAVWCVGSLLLVSASSPPQPGWQTSPLRPGVPDLTSAQTPGIILGQVIDGDTGDPIAGAVVETVRGQHRPASWAEAASMFLEYMELAFMEGVTPVVHVVADGQGRFVFRDVPPGDCPLSARRPGYLPASYGQRRPQGPGDWLTVRPGSVVTEATIRMWRYAAINGVVLDEAGEPAVGANISGLQVTMAGGRRRLAPSGSTTTDDRGVYRLANLAPGEYFVVMPSTTTSVATSTAAWYTQARAEAGSSTELLRSLMESRAPLPSTSGLRVGEHMVSASSLRSSTSPSVTADGRLEVYRTLYHPSAVTIGDAIAVRVESGEERQGVDLRLVLEPAFAVSGEVIGLDGPAVRIGVRLIPADVENFVTEAGFETAETSTDGNGRFALLGVPPGQYMVDVLRVPRATPGPRPEAPEAPTLWARQPVSVGDRDVAGLSLQLREGARVLGRLEFEGTAAAPGPEAIARVMVDLSPAGGQWLAVGSAPSRAAGDGTFRTGGYPPGRYFIAASGPISDGVGWSVRSAMLGGRDLIDQPLALGGDDVRGVVITFTDRISALSGTVQLTTDDDEALVAVFPADFRAWIADGMPARRSGTILTHTQGQFSFDGLRPGSYLAVAVPAGTALDLQDPAIVAQLSRLGTRVEVLEGGSASIRLTISQVR